MRPISAAILGLLSLSLVGCPGGGGGGPAPDGSAAPDLAVADLSLGSGWGSCTPSLLGGGACPTLGEQIACATWEHDHCCVCALVDARRSWLCDGPHAYCRPPMDVPDGGVAVEGSGGSCLDRPVSGQACPAWQLGVSFQCKPWSLATPPCCTCAPTPDGPRWECHAAWSCPPPDLGGAD